MTFGKCCVERWQAVYHTTVRRHHGSHSMAALWNRSGCCATNFMVARKWQPSPNSHHTSFHDTALFSPIHDDTTLKTASHFFELEAKKCGVKRSMVWIGQRLSLTGHRKITPIHSQIYTQAHKHVTVWLCTCYRSSKHTTTTLCMKEQSMQHLVHGQLFDTTQQQQILCTWENLQLFAQILTTTQCLHGRNMRNLN